MNTPKTVCFYHKEQIITNFCRDKKCLMPLCPNCIGEHTLYHEQTKTKPLYHSIYQMLSEVEQKLYQSICGLEADRARIEGLSKTINSISTLVQQKLSNTKLLVYEIVEQTFKELETKITNKLNSLHQETGIYCLDKAKKYEEELNDTIDELYEIHQGLKGQKYLGHAILFLKEKEGESATLHHNLSTYLETNENYSPKMELNSQFTTSLVHCLHRMFKIQGKKDFDKRKQLQREQIHSYFPRRAKDINEKSEKIERSYTPKRSTSYLKNNPEPIKQKSSIAMSNVPYYPTPKLMSQDQPQLTVQREYQPVSSTANLSQFSATPESKNLNRIQDFKYEFQMLSRKVSQMKKENEQIVKKYS